MRAWKMRSTVASNWKVTRTNAEQSLKLILLQTTREVSEELNVDHSTVIGHLKQTGKVKKLSKWVPHEQTKIQKIVILKCCLKSKQQRAISLSRCDV